MKKENNFWIDKNNNQWDCLIYSEEEADKKSKTLINCWNCQNCQNCWDCWNCRNSRNCQNCRNCQECQECWKCQGCQGCQGCQRCQEFKNNPQKYRTTKIGSRKQQTTFYWNEEKTTVVCGCFINTLEEFKKKVEKTYGNGVHGLEYKKEIEKVEYLINN